MKAFAVLAFLLVLYPSSPRAQKPEHQISFARESKPHTYYVKQAELWWHELQKDSLSEDNWYNYFRACRNAQGSANWKTDVVKESPYLRLGPDVLTLMKRQIPESFTYNYLLFLDGGVGTENGPALLKAYAMNPDFEGINSSVVSYAVSSGNDSLRKAANEHWYPKNELSPSILTYGYNVLMSVDSNAILFTQNDNDTYPLWMLQDVLGIRRDVTVINIDFLIMDDCRKRTFDRLQIEPLVLPSDRTINEYEMNWQDIVAHCLRHYKGTRPLHLGMTLFEDLYKDFSKSLIASGLTFRYSPAPLDLTSWNRRLYEQTFLLDYLKTPLLFEKNKLNMDLQSLNYINLLKELRDGYRTSHQTERAEQAQALAFAIADRTGNKDWIKGVREEFSK